MRAKLDHLGPTGAHKTANALEKAACAAGARRPEGGRGASTSKGGCCRHTQVTSRLEVDLVARGGVGGDSADSHLHWDYGLRALP